MPYNNYTHSQATSEVLIKVKSLTSRQLDQFCLTVTGDAYETPEQANEKLTDTLEELLTPNVIAHLDTLDNLLLDHDETPKKQRKGLFSKLS
jgi:hypothetical protein